MVKLRYTDEEMRKHENFMVTENFPEIGAYKSGKGQGDAREIDLHQIFYWLSLLHFGAPSSTDLSKMLKLACQLASDFFTTDWWTIDKVDRLSLSKEPSNEDFKWFKPYRLALLFASLQRDRQLLTDLAKWPESWMKAEWRATEFPVGIEQFYFLMLDKLQLAKLTPARSKIEDDRIKLLFDALSSADQKEFLAKVGESLNVFATQLKGQTKLLPFRAIAIEETILVHLWREFKGIDMLPHIHKKLQVHVLMLPT